MDDAQIERFVRALRTPLSGAPPGVVKRVSRGMRLRAGAERRKIRAARPLRMAGSEDAVKRRLPDAEVERLLKAIRTSFCTSPHKKWYWTALLDRYWGTQSDTSDAVRGPGCMGIAWAAVKPLRGAIPAARKPGASLPGRPLNARVQPLAAGGNASCVSRPVQRPRSPGRCK